MDGLQSLKTLVKEARAYREQGLLAQSREKYLEALHSIGNREGRAAGGSLRTALQKAVQRVEAELDAVDRNDSAPQLSREMKDLIRKLFSHSEDRSIAAYKGAVALARFGQYGEALEEFNRLLEQKNMASVAAKNILTCHLAFASPDVAISQYERWVSGIQLTRDQLEDIRLFLERALVSEGVQTNLSRLEDLLRRRGECVFDGELELPIYSISMPWNRKPSNRDSLEFDVFLHTGSVISIHIPPEQKDILPYLQLGTRIPGLRLFSSMAMFEGEGMIIGRKRIESGPREGHYALDIHIEAV